MPPADIPQHHTAPSCLREFSSSLNKHKDGPCHALPQIRAPSASSPGGHPSISLPPAPWFKQSFNSTKISSDLLFTVSASSLVSSPPWHLPYDPQPIVISTASPLLLCENHDPHKPNRLPIPHLVRADEHSWTETHNHADCPHLKSTLLNSSAAPPIPAHIHSSKARADAP